MYHWMASSSSPRFAAHAKGVVEGSQRLARID